MYTRSEGFITSHDNTQLFFQIWQTSQAKGTIIITHGHGEHTEAYSRFIKSFEGDAWNFYAWDLRGHGRSEGRRGYVAQFDEYCQDFETVVETILKDEQVKKGPVILFAHSMGALIQLKALIRRPDLKITAMIISSPLLGLSVPVPLYKSKGAVLLNKLIPQITMGNELSNDMLTRDHNVIKEFEQDALRHTRMSPGTFLGILASCDYVHPRAQSLKAPALFILSSNDPVISTPDAKAFYEKLGSAKKEIYIYPDAKHELVNDTIRGTVFADIKKFLDTFLETQQ